jgi:hypothetical protein
MDQVLGCLGSGEFDRRQSPYARASPTKSICRGCLVSGSPADRPPKSWASIAAPQPVFSCAFFVSSQASFPVAGRAGKSKRPKITSEELAKESEEEEHPGKCPYSACLSGAGRFLLPLSQTQERRPCADHREKSNIRQHCLHRLVQGLQCFRHERLSSYADLPFRALRRPRKSHQWKRKFQESGEASFREIQRH